ncbi:CHAT domain-containing protein [Zobellia galactanivorans]|uniref:CHAT domain-containing protein n=1 Tax=Zobellia galactanivorans (strain DSM 12802 / CCUG 47099 / CIP 106680 / NCIMB 13871 / Dsij) TaxID=63186 RepID=UPI001C06F59E|nr:CHAT domain-containing tetratricopeptide repeat protein [Zobellia galactanivorans]MBU3026550.1 CHAT domain-containing protein [Zobellia galactanivorans]
MKYLHCIGFFFVFIAQGVSQVDSIGLDEAFGRAFENHYTNKDSAYFYYDKVISMADAQDNLDVLMGGLSYLINANSNFYDLEQYGDNLERMGTLLESDARLDSFALKQVYEQRLLFDRGNYHYKLKDYVTAQNYFLELYGQLKSIPQNELTALDIDTLSAIYSFLGLIHRHTGRYEQAEFYYTQDLRLIETYGDSIEDARSVGFNTKKLLSQVYEDQNNTTEANRLLQEALIFYKTKVDNPRFKNNFLSTYMLLAKNYINQEDFDSAIAVLNENNVIRPEDNPFKKEVDMIYGDAFLGKKEFSTALSYYQKTLKSYQEYRRNKPHQDIAEAYGKIAELHLRRMDFKQGLQVVQDAFLNAGNHIADSESNPSPDQTFSKIQLLHLLDIKLQLLQMALGKTGELNYEEQALRTSDAILKTFDALKGEFDSKLDKQFLAERVYPIFYRMLAIVYRSYERNPSSKTIGFALNIAEKNKDFVLLEALRNAQATKYGGVPPQLLNKEVQLRAGITHLEKQLFDATDTITNYQEQLFDLKQEYYGLLKKLRTDFPKYYELKYESERLDLAGVKKRVLKDGSALVSYTVADDWLYVIMLHGQGEKFIKLPFDQDDQNKVKELYRLLSHPSLTGQEPIKELGGQLFEKLLERPLRGFDGEEVTIVPDGVLHYLPFDLLSDNDDYVLKTKSIGYANSVASLMKLKAKRKAETNSVLAFAPSFSGEGPVQGVRQFGRLLYNDDEVSKIDRFYHTEVVLDEKATLSYFKSNLSRYNILHLATHASANDAFPDYSYLAFSAGADSEQHSILYIKDLYNIALDADMVTLSACQTGIGKLQKGQGMLSLSKGFYYAGAKSLVNTLWKINDKSSVRLMEDFYEGLSEGKSKTRALRDAKLKYLESTDDELLKHPYYWSAFVVSGDGSPLSDHSFWWYWGAAILALVVFLIWFWKRRTQINL